MKKSTHQISKDFTGSLPAKQRFSTAALYVLTGFVAAGLVFSVANAAPVSPTAAPVSSTATPEGQVQEANTRAPAESGDSSTAESVAPDEKVFVDEASAVTSEPVSYKARPERKVAEPGTESGFPSDQLDEAVELAMLMRPSVVQMTGRKLDLGFGTGWLIQPDIVVTNQHVADLDVDYYGKLAVKTFDGRLINASIIGASEYHDVAFVKLAEPIDAPLFKMSRTRVDEGEPVISIGHASYIGNWETSAGVVTDNNYYEGDALLTSLPISGGASGSAIMRLDGSVVGIIAGTYWGTDSPSYAKPKDDVYIHTFMPRIDKNGGAISKTIVQLAKEYGVDFEYAE